MFNVQNVKVVAFRSWDRMRRLMPESLHFSSFSIKTIKLTGSSICKSNKFKRG